MIPYKVAYPVLLLSLSLFISAETVHPVGAAPCCRPSAAAPGMFTRRCCFRFGNAGLYVHFLPQAVAPGLVWPVLTACCCFCSSASPRADPAERGRRCSRTVIAGMLYSALQYRGAGSHVPPCGPVVRLSDSVIYGMLRRARSPRPCRDDEQPRNISTFCRQMATLPTPLMHAECRAVRCSAMVIAI